jgi:hypothetical protein
MHNTGRMNSTCLALAILLTWHSQAGAQVQKPCKDQAVLYDKAPDWIEKQIQINKVESGSQTGTKVKSPQFTSWFIERAPDYTKPGPWDTTLYIGKNAKDKTLLTMKVVDHGTSFEVRWINEQLLFVRVWWGHIASSDLILDTDTGTLLYDRLANYGEVVEPCD